MTDASVIVTFVLAEPQPRTVSTTVYLTLTNYP